MRVFYLIVVLLSFEEEAYACLKPNSQEVLTCETLFDGQSAEVSVVAASWIRNWQPQAVREHRFHAYVVKTQDPSSYYDVFARTLSENLKSQNLFVEGAIKTGPGNAQDGYFIRTQFQK